MNHTYLTNGKQLSFEKPLIVAILNVTPDSFYDGGRFSSISDIIKDVEIKIAEGATVIDIGAASSRPHAKGISVKEELIRLREPLRLIRKEFPKVFISVDTYVAEIANISLDMGADMINDISGGEMDPDMLGIIAKHDVPYILMHMQGTPENMQKNPTYKNVTKEIKSFFKTKIADCEELGIKKLILDVGFGFGKTVEHNYELLKNLKQFNTLDYPVLAGLSRKSMINKIIHTLPEKALNGTTVLNTIALLNGANLLRVHDVKEAKQAVELCEFYKGI
jgi:dihydropteroate synthase